MGNSFTGERLETMIYNGNTVNHLHRYAIAINYIKNKVVLDIASGEGYGSNLMSKHASFVYGVDIDKMTIEKAKKKYKKDNLQFIEGNTSQIPLECNSIDVVVSFETIEHHDKHDEMFIEIKRVLKKGGLFLISSPDKFYYSDKRNYNNKFHVKELYKSEFKKLISSYFNNFQLLSQSYLNGNSLVLDEATRENLEFYNGDYLELKKGFSYPHFLIAIVSDNDFIKQNNSIFDGSLILSHNRNSQDRVKKIYDSNSYKLGHAILLPFKFLKKIIKKII